MLWGNTESFACSLILVLLILTIERELPSGARGCDHKIGYFSVLFLCASSKDAGMSVHLCMVIITSTS